MALPGLPDEEVSVVVMLDAEPLILEEEHYALPQHEIRRYVLTPGSPEAEAVKEILSDYTYRRCWKTLRGDTHVSGLGEIQCYLNGPDFDVSFSGNRYVFLNGAVYQLGLVGDGTGAELTQRLWAVLGAMAVLGVGLLYLLPISSGTLGQVHQMLHGTVDPSFGSGRVRIWDEVVHLIGQAPLLGGGPDTLVARMGFTFTRYSQETGAMIEAVVDAAHNDFLNIAVNLGLPALAFYIAGLVCWLRGVVRHRPRAAVGCPDSARRSTIMQMTIRLTKKENHMPLEARHAKDLQTGTPPSTVGTALGLFFMAMASVAGIVLGVLSIFSTALFKIDGPTSGVSPAFPSVTEELIFQYGMPSFRFIAGFVGLVAGIFIITTVVLRVPIAYGLAFLTRSPDYPVGRPESVFISLLASWVLGALITLGAYRMGRWRRKCEAKEETL